MNSAKDLFDNHIHELRKFAEAKGFHLADVLPFVMRDGPEKVQAGIGIGVVRDKNKQLEMRAEQLIERYRPEFIEQMLDAVLKVPDIHINYSTLPFITEILAKFTKALKIANQQKDNLAVGRAKGSKKQKEYAAETWRNVEKMNAELLKHPDTARYNLEQRAEYIEKKLREQNIKQTNGKPYLASTIKTKITGMG